VERVVEQHFGDWPPVDPIPPASAYIPASGPRLTVERKAIEQVNFCVAYPGVARSHPDRWTVNLLSLILGSGTSSRLFVQLRERLGLVYDVQAYTSHFHDTGSLVVYAATDPQKTERALNGVFREIERLQRRRVADAELRKAKQYFRGRLWLGLEDTQAVASWFGGQRVLEGNLMTPEDAAAAVDAVGADDVLQGARRYLPPTETRLVAVGPVSDLQADSRLAGA
jgi:predicted Zn-dependent peptidase